MHGASAAVGFHLYLMAQPPGLPENMISALADAFFGHFLDIWATNPNAIPADVRAAYLKASREAIPSIVADYRASATVDVEHDQADLRAGNQLRVPVTVLQQDWVHSASTPPPGGGHGHRAWNTAPCPAGTSWPKKAPPRSSKPCATYSSGSTPSA
jgi:hypothetical protein